LEIRIKNEGSAPTVVERDLSIEHGYVQMYITYPNGDVMVIVWSYFVSKKCCTAVVLLGLFYQLFMWGI